ncbi:transferrin-binding protein-like solute binding protein [Conchiformibius kuhniae]|uniref:Transferrin-binding protein B n=1 Tax=Conchiformibius kuhniae TaxID=211502 RepID=A0A8T9MX25_9NEIS|nr:transferrin-binding protein-like solute binding protein [Conchiformibius kuhniae]
MKSTFSGKNLLLCLLLSACAGGSFDVDPVVVVSPPPPDDRANLLKDADTPPKISAPEAEGFMKPALGYSMPILRRNKSRTDAAGKEIANGKQAEEHLLLKPSDIRALHPTDIVAAPHRDELAKRQPDAGVDVSTPAQRGYQFVHAGYLVSDKFDSSVEFDRRKGIDYEGSEGYVFYQGRNPAQALPSQTVRYEGHWDFVTDVKRHRTNLFHNGDEGGAEIVGGGRQMGFEDLYGESTGAVGMAEIDVAKDKKLGFRARQHLSEFEVDFANKSLTGKLNYRPHQPITGDPDLPVRTRYTIDAKINGNRFSGKVKAVDRENPRNYFFLADSDFLEGGFYGGRGEELAGKFLANDNSLFGVFAAKQDNPADAEKITDAYDINISSSDAVALRPMSNFGSADKLLVDGETLSLLPDNNELLTRRDVTLPSGREVGVTVCCGNLSYLKFGHMRKTKLADDPAPVAAGADDVATDSAAFSGAPYGSFLFVQGERTRSADMPAEDGATYRGTWDGFSMKNIAWRSLPGSGTAEFKVDFGTKDVSGRLTETNGVRPAFYIDAKIQGNGFAGTVRTHADGINLDPGREGNSPKLLFRDVAVQGGFYGPKALELGGTFFNDEHKTGAVFGAKRQVSGDK